MNIRHLCPLGSSMCDCFDNARDVSGEAVRARDVTPAAELHLKRSVKLQPSVRAGAAALVAGFPTEESLEDRSDGKLDCQQPLEDCVLQPRWVTPFCLERGVIASRSCGRNRTHEPSWCSLSSRASPTNLSVTDTGRSPELFLMQLLQKHEVFAVFNLLLLSVSVITITITQRWSVVKHLISPLHELHQRALGLIHVCAVGRCC